MMVIKKRGFSKTELTVKIINHLKQIYRHTIILNCIDNKEYVICENYQKLKKKY